MSASGSGCLSIDASVSQPDDSQIVDVDAQNDSQEVVPAPKKRKETGPRTKREKFGENQPPPEKALRLFADLCDSGSHEIRNFLAANADTSISDEVFGDRVSVMCQAIERLKLRLPLVDDFDFSD